MKDRILQLIEKWGLRFESLRNTIPLFYEVYIQLKKKGVLFPKNHDESDEEKNSEKSNNSEEEKGDVVEG